jgi:hypothetical protein
MQMNDEAKATGGRAFYDNNDLAEISSKIIATDADFYSLSYSPRDFKQDNKWHNVKVTIDGGPYTLSYRTGYYGDGINSPDPKQVKASRTLLTSNGEKIQRPENYSEPIIFHADVQPSSSVVTAEIVPVNSPTLTEKKTRLPTPSGIPCPQQTSSSSSFLKASVSRSEPALSPSINMAAPPVASAKSSPSTSTATD